ncbi:hypothetical protein ACVC7V_06655 [Hydrogenophaga sp. A37]|uniref:hypothetical protein n=1 Tax=Hydrogenophaga sp. A37 TaxID=1945864 RepID=UPI00117A60C2|nr:hypothetical protein [Hydrogenophaga sp. A37]
MELFSRHRLLPATRAARGRLVAGLCVGLLVACGGGQSGGDAQGSGAGASMARDSDTPMTEAQALQAGAALNAKSLQDALSRAQTLPATSKVAPGDVAPISAYAQGEVSRKAVGRVSVFRFYNTGTGAHFYTTSVDEREQVYRTAPSMSPEGEAFYAASAASTGLSPVHRFFNTQTGVHFYTISEEERVSVQANLPQFNYEGVAYHASLVPAAGFKPLYRFFVRNQGVHFYTASEEESLSVQANMTATHQYEGVGYYVMDAACASPPCGSTGPNRPRVFIALHGNNQLADNASLDAQWTYVRQNAHGIWGNNANISDAQSASLIRKMTTRNLITEYPVPSGAAAWLPLSAFNNLQVLYPDLDQSLNPEAIAFYTSDISRWNGRTVAQAEAIYTNPAASATRRYGGVYTGWQPQNFDPANAKYIYNNPNALMAFRSSKGTFIECPLGACTSGKLGEAFRRAIRETHVRGRPFIWFASNSGSPGWLAAFQATYNAVATEGLWRSEDVIAIVNYGGVYPKVPEAVGGVAADTSTGLAYWALQQRAAATP